MNQEELNAMLRAGLSHDQVMDLNRLMDEAIKGVGKDMMSRLTFAQSKWKDTGASDEQVKLMTSLVLIGNVYSTMFFLTKGGTETEHLDVMFKTIRRSLHKECDRALLATAINQALQACGLSPENIESIKVKIENVDIQSGGKEEQPAPEPKAPTTEQFGGRLGRVWDN